MDRLFDLEEPNIFGPPSSPGVYAVCIRRNERKCKERILYIGSSSNVSKRLHNSAHQYLICFRRFPDHLVYTKTISTGDFIELEKKLIGTYRPLLNKQWK